LIRFIQYLYEREIIMDSCKIYLLTNKINGKVYIGQTWLKNAQDRMGKSATNYRNCKYLYAAIKKHGYKNFEYTILEDTAPKDESEEAQKEVQILIDKLEDEYIIKYDSRNPDIGYNIKEGGRGGKHSEETKKKISEALSGEKSPWFGKHLSEEAKQKISEANTGNIRTQEQKDQQSKDMIEWHKENPHPMLGKHHTPETLEKISEAGKGRIMPREAVERGAKKRIKISKEKEQEIIADYLSGMTARDIMDKHNYSHIYRVLDRNNIPLVGGNRNDWTGRSHSQETKDKMSNSAKETWDKRRVKENDSLVESDIK